MKQVDYIIVGCGLAGIAFCEQLRANNKTFVVFDNASQQSSTVAGGLYNPVVLKRFTPVWQSEVQLKLALPYYKSLEELLHVKLDYKLPVYRKFASVEEQNNWFTASDKVGLTNFLSLNIIKNTSPSINASFGFGKVLHSGRIDTSQLIDSYTNFLKKEKLFIQESFNYSELKIENNQVIYNTITAKHIVFAEGYGLKHNPYFNYLPLKGTKGELLTIKATELNIDFVLKSGVFIIPLGKDLYRVGATYEWTDKTNTPTEKAKDELITKLKTLINCNYTIISQVAGIRPTVIDRRPLIGEHSRYKNMYVLNGLGTRGVMIAPYAAKQLYESIEHGVDLDKEINIKRFE